MDERAFVLEAIKLKSTVLLANHIGLSHYDTLHGCINTYIRLTPDMCDDKELVMEAGRLNKMDFRAVSKRLRDDDEVVSIFLKADGKNLKHCPLRFRKDKDSVIQAIESNLRAVMYMHVSLRLNSDVALAAFCSGCSNRSYYSYIYSDARDDKEFVVSALMKGGSIAMVGNNLANDVEFMTDFILGKLEYKPTGKDFQAIRNVVFQNAPLSDDTFVLELLRFFVTKVSMIGHWFVYQQKTDEKPFLLKALAISGFAYNLVSYHSPLRVDPDVLIAAMTTKDRPLTIYPSMTGDYWHVYREVLQNKRVLLVGLRTGRLQVNPLSMKQSTLYETDKEVRHAYAAFKIARIVNNRRFRMFTMAYARYVKDDAEYREKTLHPDAIASQCTDEDWVDNLEDETKFGMGGFLSYVVSKKRKFSSI